MSRKVFTAGEVLAAADVNSFLMDQTVMSFAGTAARGSAIPSPVDGMVTYNTSSDLLEVYDGSAYKIVSATTGGILQVVNTQLVTTFTVSGGSFADVTGLSVSITPKSSTSKILVMANIFLGGFTSEHFFARLLRDSTVIGAGTAAGSRTSAFGMIRPGATNDGSMQAQQVLDSPATTSALTYKIQVRSDTGGVVAVNRSNSDADSVSSPRAASNITVMEVSA
jgi:hypothetical protein